MQDVFLGKALEDTPPTDAFAASTFNVEVDGQMYVWYNGILPMRILRLLPSDNKNNRATTTTPVLLCVLFGVLVCSGKRSARI